MKAKPVHRSCARPVTAHSPSRTSRAWRGAVLVLAATALGEPGLAQGIPLFPGRRYAAGPDTYDIVLADANRDGRLDVIVAGHGTPGTVAVLSSLGAFGLSESAPLPVAGSGPPRLAAGDFDSDGSVDVAVAQSGSDGVSVLINDGAGGFGAPAAWPVGSKPTDVALVDLDGDGRLDAGVVHWTSDFVSVLLGDGAGGFAPRVDYDLDAQQAAIVAGDVNGDARPDLAVAGLAGGIFVLLGDGLGGFPSIPSWRTGAGGFGTALADVDGDARVDIVSTSFASEEVCVLLNGGMAGAPGTYCSAKVNSQGCTPAIAFSGLPSASSGVPFTITTSAVINQKPGLLIYGFASASLPFQGGTLCIGGTLRRTPLQSSGGSAAGSNCSGSFAFDFNAHIQSGIDSALVPGTSIFAQYYYRDPADPLAVGLSDAVAFAIFP